MAEEHSGIPLADVLRAANELVSAGLIEDYALGGALAAIYYTEPFTIPTRILSSFQRIER